MINFIKKLFAGNGGQKIIQRKQEVTIGIQNNLVVMDFHRTIKYLSMDGQTAIKMGSAIKKRGQECLKKRPSQAGKT